jgi:C-terminal processing protease CtpA/Prc
LEPDIEVEISDEDIEQGNDPQLDKAIEIIKEL